MTLVEGQAISGVSRFGAYPEYRDSCVPWLRNIPAHWGCLALSRVTVSRCDGPFGSAVKSEHYSEGGVRVIRLQNIGWASFRNDDRAFIDKAYASELGDHSVRPGDLLIAGLGDEGHPVGRSCVAPSDLGPAMVKADCFRFRLQHRRVDARFLAYQLSATAEAAAGSGSTGATRARMNLATMASRKVTLPPIEEQRGILRFLDRETAKTDALVAKKERLIELLQEKRTALITRAVTKGLDPTVPMKDSGVEWLPQIPAHWEIRPNGRLFRERDDRGFPDLPLLNVSISAGVQVREFSDERIEQKAEDPSVYKRALAGDIAFNKMRMWQGAVGVAPVDGLVSPDYVVAEPLCEVDSRFFGLLFRTSPYMTEVNRHSHGIVDDRNRLYWDGFKRIKSILPRLEEQQAIVAYLDRETARIEALVGTIGEGIERLREYRTALISAAVTGKIDVRHEVPTS